MASYADHHHIEAHHRVIDARLVNWARWVKVTPRAQVSPMFRMYQSKSRQWHQPQIRDTVDLLDAQHIEKLMRHLPFKNREAVVWSYVYPELPPAKVRTYLGVTHSGLSQLVKDGRQMLLNLSAS